MADREMTAQQAIETSIMENRTVHLDYDAATMQELLVESDDSADSETETEYWGTTEEGSEWRVHVAIDPDVLAEAEADWRVERER